MEFKFSNLLKGDKVFWYAVIMLGAISILAVYSSSGGLAYRTNHGDTFYFFKKQFVFVLMGLVGILITQMIPYRIYKKYALYAYYATFILVVITIFVGKTEGGASRWLEIPFIGIQFQPSDLGRLAMVILAAKLLSGTEENGEIKILSLKKIFIFTLLMAAFTIFSGFSTTVIFLSTILAMAIAAGVKRKYLAKAVIYSLLSLAIIVGGLYLAGQKGRLKVVENRLNAFLHPEEEDTYQIDRAKVAIVRGGITGVGPGNSIQRNNLSQSNSDFIFASIIEEYGLLGAIIIIALYLWILYRGIYIAKNCDETFPMLLAIGIILSISIQAFTHMIVATDIGPVTGQNLPFVSLGGTSILTTGFAFGIIMNIGHTLRKKKIQAEQENFTNE